MALASLLESVKNGMLHARLPLGEIYAAVRDPTLAENGFLEVLCREGLWSALSSELLCIPREEISFLFVYAESLGKRFAEQEIIETQKAIEALSRLLDLHRTEGAKKHKLQKTLVVTGGGMFLLLLL